MMWEKTQLNKKTSFIKRGISPSYVLSDGFIIVNQKCIHDNIIDLSFSKLTDNQKNYSTEKLLQKGDILINSTGRGTLGRTAQIKDEIKEPYFVDSHIILKENRFAKTMPV